jgi:hypothetical protein
MGNIKFDGFPAGELRFTSVPDLFFAELLPDIDDLAELKITLHIIWLRQRGGKQVVTQAEGWHGRWLADRCCTPSLKVKTCTYSTARGVD